MWINRSELVISRCWILGFTYCDWISGLTVLLDVNIAITLDDDNAVAIPRGWHRRQQHDDGVGTKG